MNVLLVSPLPPPVGGIATWTENYLKFFNGSTVNVDIVNNATIGKRANDFGSKRNILEEILRLTNIVKKIVSFRRNEKYDIVHICTSCSPMGILKDYICMFFCGKDNIVLHCHCNIEDQIHNNKIGLFFLEKSLKKAKCIFVLNQKSKEYVSKFCSTQTEIVPNFIAESLVSNSCVIKEKVKEIVFVGHIIKTKGVLELVSAAESFPDIHFSFVGPIANEMSTIECTKNVDFLGSKTNEEVCSFLEKADVFAFPSYTEGFSVALLEAMSKGLPCIATEVGANKEMLEEKGGVIIPAKDEQAIIDAISFICNKEIRQQMSEWNIKKVRSCYTENIVLNRIAELYGEIVKGK